ncbi:MAG: tRNA-dihydrouridine synthase [Tepidanaerobacteraceae bacterium]|nr:tRNA-dihydrouridine synthase [Tepidanaerobacteraceae bacterium]
MKKMQFDWGNWKGFPNLDFPPIFLAPMAGITDLPFRLICKEFGADVVITEMVSSRGIYYGDPKTESLLAVDPGEHPIGVQLFGNDPEFFFHAIEKIKDRPFDFINVNMGCPTPKIVKNGDGCALMREPALAREIIRESVRASRVPVTVKIRKGWDDEHVNAVEFSKMAEESGAAMVIIHGRTREQFYSGKADWDIIRRIKEAVSVPVIGNGDVFSAKDALSMLEQTGCDGVMVGRGALGNPFIFREIKHYLKTGEKLPKPTLEERKLVIYRHLDLALNFHGEKIGLLEMRKHIAWYLKGLPHSSAIKQKIQRSNKVDEIKSLLEEYFVRLRNAAGQEVI